MLPFLGPNVNKLKAKRDVEGLAKLLATPKDPAMRRAAAHALGELGWKADEDEVALVLLARAEWAKCASLGDRGVSALIRAAESWDRESRLSAIGALASVGDVTLTTKVQAVLEHLAAERDKTVSEAAVAALQAYSEQVQVLPLVVRNVADDTASSAAAVEQATPVSPAPDPVPSEVAPSEDSSEGEQPAPAEPESTDAPSSSSLFDDDISDSLSTVSFSQIELGESAMEERALAVVGGDEAQSSLVSSLLRGHVIREAPSAVLDQHMSGDVQVLLVSGPPGIGKSALLANWLVRFHQLSARGLSRERPLVLGLFCGADRASTEGDQVLRRLAASLRDGAGVEVPSVVPLSSQAAFATALAMAAVSRSVVLVLDGVDLIEWKSGDRSLSWIPQVLPPTVRLVLSSSSAAHANAAAERGWDVLPLQPIDALERRDIFSNGLGSLWRRLSSAQMDLICSSSDSGVPLYLRLIVDEIALRGAPQDIGDFLDDISRESTVQDLFGKLFKRAEKRGERGLRGLVGDALSSLWVSGSGLTPAELREALSARHGVLVDDDWAAFESSIRGFVRRGASHWYLANDHVRAAVSRRYVTGDEQQRKAHELLGRGFGQSAPLRRTQELAWHLLGSGETDRMVALLSDPKTFSLLYETDRAGLVRMWTELETQGKAKLQDAHGIDSEESQDHVLMWRVGTLLHELGHHAEAAQRMGPALQSVLSRGVNVEETWRLGDSLRATGDWKLALEQMGQADRALAPNGNQKARALLLRVMSQIQAERGRLMDAVRYIDRAEEALRAAGLEPDLHMVSVVKAELLLRLGNPTEATQIGREVEVRSRQNGNAPGLVRSLRLQSDVCTARGDVPKATILANEAAGLESRLGLVTSK